MEILIPITLFAMIGAVIILPRYFKSVERRKLADTLRVAIERGQPIPDEVVAAMSSAGRGSGQPASPQRDVRTGVLWLVTGLAFIALGVAISFNEPDVLYPMLGVAAFPTFIGLAFLALGLLHKPRA